MPQKPSRRSDDALAPQSEGNLHPFVLKPEDCIDALDFPAPAQTVVASQKKVPTDDQLKARLPRPESTPLDSPDSSNSGVNAFGSGRYRAVDMDD